MQNAILSIVRDKDRVAEPDLYSFLLFECGLYSGGPTPLSPTDRWRFTALVVAARKRLVADALLHATEDRSFQITARGRTFLSMGLTKLDAQARRTLASVPAEQMALQVAAERTPPAEDDDALDLEDEATNEEPNVPEFDILGLFEDAGLKYLTGENGGHVIPIEGKLGSWLIVARESHGWLCLSTHVLNLPDEPRAKSAVIEAALKTNIAVSAWKFGLTKFGEIRLEAEYRVEHIDGPALKNIVWMLEGLIAEKCAELVRMASVPQPLDALEQAFKRSA
jgi:hypothetical protein